MTIDEAVELLYAEFEKAKNLEYIYNPLAYALYRVWLKADKAGRQTKKKGR